MRNTIEHGICTLEATVGQRLPKHYRAFLKEKIGLAEVISLETRNGDSLYGYGYTQLQERNSTYAIQDIAPHLLLIGQDGDMGYFLDLSQCTDAVYSADLGALGCTDMQWEAESILEL